VLNGFGLKEKQYMSQAMLQAKADEWNDVAIPLTERKARQAEEMSNSWVPTSQRRQQGMSGEGSYRANVDSITSERPKDCMQKTSWRREATGIADETKNEHMAEDQEEMGPAIGD
jgi:hypothetical protein